MAETVIGVIGGSGVYAIDGLEGAAWTTVDSPFGRPSDAILTGRLNGVRMAFLPRHGRGHVHSPTTVPYRANIDAMKRLGVTDIFSVSACGSFREAMAPGDFVIVDQFIDRSARGWAMRRKPRRGRKASPCTAAAPIWRWRGRSFPRWPKAGCTARSGAAT